jgi:hypothetical protein
VVAAARLARREFDATQAWLAKVLTAGVERSELRGAERERCAELERQAVERLESELLKSIETWLTVRDDREAPAAARLAAADRVVERLLGRVGEKLLVQRGERREVTVRYDVERLAEIVRGADGARGHRVTTGRGPLLFTAEIHPALARVDAPWCTGQGPARCAAS